MKEIQAWLEEWLQLWPDNIQHITGYNVQSKPEDCINRMVKFMKDNKQYDKAIIFEATETYLTQQEQKGWLYTKQAAYFISKLGQPSLLAQYCEGVVNKAVNKPQVIDPYAPINDFI